MSEKLSMTAAVKMARKVVSQPESRGLYGYSVYGPYRDHEPRGIRTESQYVSYWAARQGRTAWCASVALCAMGYKDHDLAGDAYYAAQHGGDLISVLRRVLPVSR